MFPLLSSHTLYIFITSVSYTCVRQSVIADPCLLTISSQCLFIELYTIINSWPIAHTLCAAWHNNDVNVEVTTLQCLVCCSFKYKLSNIWPHRNSCTSEIHTGTELNNVCGCDWNTYILVFTITQTCTYTVCVIENVDYSLDQWRRQGVGVGGQKDRGSGGQKSPRSWSIFVNWCTNFGLFQSNKIQKYDVKLMYFLQLKSCAV